MHKNQEKKPTIGVILLAAGSSTRMDGDDKIFMPIYNNPLLYYSLKEFNNSCHISSISIVLNEKNYQTGMTYIKSLNFDKVTSICIGGSRRQDSVLNGLNALGKHDFVLIHDAARPCINQCFINRAIESVTQFNASIPVIPSTDTLRTLSDDDFADKIVDRETIWITQTPQCFSYELISEALSTSIDSVTDDAMLVQKLGVKIKTFKGSKANIKVTTNDDIAMVKSIIKEKK